MDSSGIHDKRFSMNTNLYSPYLAKMNAGLNGFGMSSFMKRDQYPTQPAFTANPVADVFQKVRGKVKGIRDHCTVRAAQVGNFDNFSIGPKLCLIFKKQMPLVGHWIFLS